VDDVYNGDPGSSPGSAEFAYRILSEGDSWFTIGGIPSSNLLYEMRFPRQGIVVNIAYPGDTLGHIAQIASNRDLKKMLTERFGYRWHVILLSAGGNDLMDRASRVLRNPGSASADPRDYVSAAEIERFVADVQQGYRTIVALRDSTDSVNNRVPIVAHCYDFPTPRNAPARFFSAGLLGPWLHKAFNDRRIEESMRVRISDYLVNVLAEAIAVLAAGPAALPNFHFVDTRGTLERAAVGSTGLSGDWLNEIHPSQAGYRKVADRIEAKILSLLPA
jgi:lysophospholipase L1-like esterase